tara:strand:- start:4666 stop:5082 length:417 start_codon:yes stop_codon:yes gene_type:complete
MAYYTGVIASIKLGDSASPTDILGQCTSYSVDKQLESVDVSHIGSASKTFTSAQESWSSTMEVSYDQDDTAQAKLLERSAGASTPIYVSYYYEGADTGDKYLTGQGFITGIAWNQEPNGVITASVSIQGTGALSEATA